ncbi:MAG TPA: hypothetical protein VIP46_21870, partial [Pyrinomonadaceae bacterium]
GGLAGDGRAADGRKVAGDVRGESKRDEKKTPPPDRAASKATRERVAAQGTGDSRPRVVGQSGAKVR